MNQPFSSLLNSLILSQLQPGIFLRLALSEIDDLQLQHQPEYFQQPPRGDLDVIMGRTWIKNPGNLAINPDLDWPVHLYDGGMPGENHDIVAMDLDLDGREEIISYATK
jgi:hypothetical protein